MDVGGVGDAAHEWDEVAVGEVGVDRSGGAGAGEQFGADGGDLAFQFGGAGQGVVGGGTDFGERGVADLGFDESGEVVGEGVPGVVVFEGFGAVGGEGFEAGCGDGFEECFGGREVSVDGADSESCAACDVVELQWGAFVHQFSGDGDDPVPVAGGVFAQRSHVSSLIG